MEFVNFEIAELLFKLGFCEKCFGHYYQEPNSAINNHKEDLVEYNCLYRGANYKDMLQNDLVLNILKDNAYPNIKVYNAPILDQAIDWIAEHFNIHICTIPFASFASLNKIAYIWTYKYDSNGSDIKTVESEFSYINKNECKKDAILATLKFILDNPEKFKVKS
jgi:hypothetical protein